MQVLFDGAEAVLAGNSEAFLTGLVTASGASLSLRSIGADTRAIRRPVAASGS